MRIGGSHCGGEWSAGWFEAKHPEEKVPVEMVGFGVTLDLTPQEAEDYAARLDKTRAKYARLEQDAKRGLLRRLFDWLKKLW